MWACEALDTHRGGHPPSRPTHPPACPPARPPACLSEAVECLFVNLSHLIKVFHPRDDFGEWRDSLRVEFAVVAAIDHHDRGSRVVVVVLSHRDHPSDVREAHKLILQGASQRASQGASQEQVTEGTGEMFKIVPNAHAHAHTHAHAYAYAHAHAHARTLK